PNGTIPAGQPNPRGLGPGSPIAFPTNCGAAVAAFAARGAFKITENESPRPQDRVYVTYNGYSNINPGMNMGQGQENVHREVLGFETTFLNGDASIGMRLPFAEITGDPQVRHQDIGDLTTVFKYAFVNDCDTGNVLSGGLVLTLPTGPSFLPAGLPNIHHT